MVDILGQEVNVQEAVGTSSCGSIHAQEKFSLDQSLELLYAAIQEIRIAPESEAEQGREVHSHAGTDELQLLGTDKSRDAPVPPTYVESL